MTTPKVTPDPLADYRTFLVAAEQKSQEDFDKTVLALSGGALGISFTFLKDVIGTNPISDPELLFGAWVSWALSTFSVLFSYYLSHLALRRAISQVDQGTIYKQRPGGALALCTAALNAAGAILFLAGVLSITLFARENFIQRGAENGNARPPKTSTAATGASASSASSAASSARLNSR